MEQNLLTESKNQLPLLGGVGVGQSRRTKN